MCRQALIIAAALALPLVSFAQVDIDRLIADSGLEPGPVAMRDRPNWRPPKKIVIRTIRGIDADFESDAPGVEIVRVTTVEEAIAAADADAIVGFCSEELLAAAERVTWIQIFSAGAERCLTRERVSNGEVLLTNYAEDVIARNRRARGCDDAVAGTRPDRVRQGHAERPVGR